MKHGKIFGLIVIMASLVSCSGSKSNKKSFVYCSEGSPTAFNPQVTTDGTSNNASAHTIYNRLVDFAKGSTKITPALAESYDISEDKLTYTFKLRKGVKFHKTKYFTPARDFNADDVIFSFNRMFDKSHPYHKVSGGTYEYFNGMAMGKLIKEINKLDDYSVQIVLNHPEAPFLANMAMSFMSILSKEYADKLVTENKKDNIDNFPIGTGPFIFQSYQKDNVIKYKSNKDYYRGKPNIDRLIFAITPDASVRYQKLKAGECHLIIEPSPTDLAAMQKAENIKLEMGPGLNVGYLAMNTQKKPFNDIRVRKAINMALNRNSYIDAIYLGHAKVAKNPLPPTIWSYNNQVKDYDYNPEAAKKLLAEAGLTDGFETTLWTLPVSRPYNPNGKKMGELMQADLAKIGIKIKLVTYDWPTYLKKSSQGEHEMLQLGWTGDNGDPDNFLHVLLGCEGVSAGSNYARWCNNDFESLITEAKRNTDQTVRTALYEKAQVIFKEQAPWVTLAHSTIFRAMAKNVTGYVIDPLGGDIFDTVDIK
jgi:dipeptide transport system substrate-binding protein